MHIRRAFTVFLEVQSQAAPRAAAAADWTLDWRWFDEPAGDDALPGKRPLIDWPSWVRPRTPGPS